MIRGEKEDVNKQEEGYSVPYLTRGTMLSKSGILSRLWPGNAARSKPPFVPSGEIWEICLSLSLSLSGREREQR